MVASTLQRSPAREPGPRTAPTPDTRPAARGGGAALRAMSFDEGAAALTPPENRAVQQRRHRGSAPAHAPGELSPREVLDSWDANRVAGVSVEWMAALQTALGVPATGLSSKELVSALARLQADTGQKRADGVLTSATRKWLVQQFPELAGIPQKAEAADLQKAHASTKGATPEDEAVRLAGAANSYSAYVAGLKAMSFLGTTVIGHPEFLARLANAQQYLAGKFPGQSDAEIGRSLGVTKTSHFRASSWASDQMYHGLGFALDVNPPQNNWLFSHGNRGKKLSAVMKHVGDLFGEDTIRNAKDMSKNAKNGTTEELFDKLAASNDALRRYRQLGTDRAALEAHIASDKAPAAAKSKGADKWMRTILDDEKWLADTMSEGAEDKQQGHQAGFMDFHKELVTALRDAAGLRWGGADLGGDNGDLMHFDGGTMDTARRLRNKTKDVRAKAAAARTEGQAQAPS